MNKRNISQKEVKWVHSENEAATADNYHGYYGSKRKIPYIGEEYDGNSALCNKNYGQSEDGEGYMPIEKLDNHGLKRERVCLRCLKIYDKLPTN